MTSAFFKSPWNFQKFEYSKIQIQNSNSKFKFKLVMTSSEHNDVRTKIPLGSVRK